MVVTGTGDNISNLIPVLNMLQNIILSGCWKPGILLLMWDTAECLHFIGAKSNFVGPIKVSNGSSLSIQEIGCQIWKYLNAELLFYVGSSEKQLVLYAISYTWQMSISKTEYAGFTFADSEADAGMVLEWYGATVH